MADKLADLLDGAVQAALPVLSQEDTDLICGVVLDALHMREGIAALSEDETIREGVFRAALPDGATEWRAE